MHLSGPLKINELANRKKADIREKIIPMSLTLSQLKSQRSWRAATTLSKEEFYRLLPWFTQAYEMSQGTDIASAQSNLKKAFAFSNYEELLFFILFTLKNPSTYDVNGLIFGISQSAAVNNFRRGMGILHKALELSGQLPAQEFEDEEALQACLSRHGVLKIDATELSIQRPKDKQKQKNHYSGKKSAIR